MPNGQDGGVPRHQGLGDGAWRFGPRPDQGAQDHRAFLLLRATGRKHYSVTGENHRVGFRSLKEVLKAVLYCSLLPN